MSSLCPTKFSVAGLLGVSLSLATAAAATWRFFTTKSIILEKVTEIPAVKIADLQSLLADHEAADATEKFVFVSGTVLPKTADDIVVSRETGQSAVVLQRTETLRIWKKQFFIRLKKQWSGSESNFNVNTPWKNSVFMTISQVPFILTEDGQSDFVTVNLDNSSHPLPLTRDYYLRHIYVIHPVDKLVYLRIEEKILSMGKNVNAVGVLSSVDGVHEIKASNDIPYFLTYMTKDQLVAALASNIRIFYWSSMLCGLLSFGIMGYFCCQLSSANNLMGRVET